MFSFNVEPNKTALNLAAVVTALVGAHLAGIISTYTLGHDHVFGLIAFFNLDGERNLPALVSTLLLLFSAALLVLVAFAPGSSARADFGHWMVLAAVFVFLAFDEAWSIHERLILPTRQALGTSGVFTFAWIIPYGIATLVILAPYIGFLKRLPHRTALELGAAGAIYLAGVIGIEMLGGRHSDLYGERNAGYAIIVMLEETLEFAGLVIFIHALLVHLRDMVGELRIGFGASLRPEARQESRATPR